MPFPIATTRAVPVFTIGDAADGSWCATVAAGTTAATAAAGAVALGTGEACNGLRGTAAAGTVAATAEAGAVDLRLAEASAVALCFVPLLFFFFDILVFVERKKGVQWHNRLHAVV